MLCRGVRHEAQDPGIDHHQGCSPQGRSTPPGCGSEAVGPARFDPPVGGFGAGQREQQPHGGDPCQFHGIGLCRGAQPDHHGPVPQVKRIRPGAQPAHGRCREQRRHPGAFARGSADHHTTEQGHQQKSALVKPGHALVHGGHAPQQRSQRGNACQVEQAIAGAGGHARFPGVPPGGQGRAGQQPHQMGVGAQVNPAGVTAIDLRGVKPGHPARTGHGDQPRRHAQTLPAGLVQKPQHGQRPQQVILLFDGQRPQVLQQSGVFNGLEIRLLGHDLPPVGHIQKGGRQVFAQARQSGGQQQGRERHQHQQHDHCRRKEAACSAHVKRREIDAPGLGMLLQQKRRDDETRHGEENVHPQKTGR